MVKFIRNEKSFFIALAAIVLVLLLASNPAIHASNLLTGLLFIVVFSVIIYAAMGVVHHAEQLAHKLGEPYGTMLLTLSAVTVEVIMVATMMFHADDDPTLARNTIFSTVMILFNGLIGLCMLLGGLKFGEQKYNLKSSNSFFSMIFSFVGAGLFIPLIVKPESIKTYYIFLIIFEVLLYVFFIRMQSKEHNYYFIFQKEVNSNKTDGLSEADRKQIKGFYHTVMLLLTITAISFLAETLSIVIDDGVDKLHWPAEVAGLVVALIIVSPEGLTAIRAGLKNDMQRVVNISLGSVLSTISLTIPVVLLIGIFTHKEIILAVSPDQAILIVISLLVGMLSYKDGETNALQGLIHLMLFVTFVVLIFL